MLCAIYARVSTAGQLHADAQWASLPRQVDDLRALAARLGWAVGLVVQEQGSGAKGDRPGWREVLDAARSGAVGAVLAVSFDRLTRSERIGDWEALKDELRALGVRLVTLKQGEIDLSGSADAETRSDFDAVLSKRERLVTRQRTVEGWTAKARAGEHTGHQAPYGYATRYDEATGARVFLVDEGRAELVREVFDRYLAGAGCHAIADALNLRGVPSPKGGAWSHVAIGYMLDNALYAGIQEVRQDAARRAGVEPEAVLSKAFPAILPLETLRAARAEAARRSAEPGRYETATIHPLSGLLRCPGCDGPMHFHGAGGGDHPSARRYACRGAGKTCKGWHSWNADVAEDAVRRALAKRLGKALDRPAQPSAAPSPAGDADALRQEIAGLEAEEVELARQLGQGALSAALFARAHAAIAAEIAERRTRLVRLEMAAVPALDPAQRLLLLANLRAALDAPDLSREELRGLFATTVAGVWLRHHGWEGRGPRRRKVLQVQRLDVRF